MTKKRKSSARRRAKPSEEEIAAIELEPPTPDEDERTLVDRFGGVDGIKYGRLLRLSNPEDDLMFHQIINDTDRYTVLESEFTWEKSQGLVIGRVVFLMFVDHSADLS